MFCVRKSRRGWFKQTLNKAYFFDHIHDWYFMLVLIIHKGYLLSNNHF